MTINEIQDEIIQEFLIFDDWMDKYSYIIDLGNDLTDFNEDARTDQNLIEGCQSKVWFNANYKDGTITFEADSDAIITKGIASLLIRILSGRTPDEILNTDLYFIEKIGLTSHLSPTRSNGLMSMIKQLKLYAMAYKSLNK
ncbi:MAG: SufE family protein [Bacteroidales bacterium]|jgi:cysteine desulfuration protein SufE|nr:SufE family protein [Bacteroidales bacterium]MDD4216587.1 SufE family protein [Bacteroidales bacterium]MDY0140788.1 SufE family protein [Bacteroidales bacterium]